MLVTLTRFACHVAWLAHKSWRCHTQPQRCVYVCVRAVCVRAVCVRAYVRAYVRACVCVCVCVTPLQCSRVLQKNYMQS